MRGGHGGGDQHPDAQIGVECTFADEVAQAFVIQLADVRLAVIEQVLHPLGAVVLVQLLATTGQQHRLRTVQCSQRLPG